MDPKDAYKKMNEYGYGRNRGKSKGADQAKWMGAFKDELDKISNEPINSSEWGPENLYSFQQGADPKETARKWYERWLKARAEGKKRWGSGPLPMEGTMDEKLHANVTISDDEVMVDVPISGEKDKAPQKLTDIITGNFPEVEVYGAWEDDIATLEFKAPNKKVAKKIAKMASQFLNKMEGVMDERGGDPLQMMYDLLGPARTQYSSETYNLIWKAYQAMRKEDMSESVMEGTVGESLTEGKKVLLTPAEAEELIKGTKLRTIDAMSVADMLNKIGTETEVNRFYMAVDKDPKGFLKIVKMWLNKNESVKGFIMAKEDEEFDPMGFDEVLLEAFFKKGDSVVVDNEYDDYSGEEGVVDSVEDGDDGITYMVKFDDGEVLPYLEDELIMSGEDQMMDDEE